MRVGKLVRPAMHAAPVPSSPAIITALALPLVAIPVIVPFAAIL
jgi:hypothetical protein